MNDYRAFFFTYIPQVTFLQLKHILMGTVVCSLVKNQLEIIDKPISFFKTNVFYTQNTL